MSRTKKIYRLCKWQEWHIRAQSARLSDPPWLPVPTRADERWRRRLLMMRGGVEAYGVLSLLRIVGATMPERGVLEDECGPLDEHELALKTGAPVEAFERAMPLLVRIGYVDEVMRTGDGAIVTYAPESGLFQSPQAPDEGHSSATGAPVERPYSDGGSPVEHPSSADPADHINGHNPDTCVTDSSATRALLERHSSDTGAPLETDETKRRRRREEIRREKTKEGALAVGVEGGALATLAPATSDSLQKNLSDPSGSDSLPSAEGAGDAPAEADLDTQRRKAWNRFLLLVSPLWSVDETQRRSDRTDTERLFADYVWAEDSDPPPDVSARLAAVHGITEHARRNARKPMAWFKSRLDPEIGRLKP